MPPERTYGVEDGLLDETVFRLFEDSRGDLWIGTAHGENVPQLFRWRRESDAIESVPFEPGVPGDSPLAFAEDADGTLWVGCDWGLRRHRSGRFELLGEANGVPATSVDDLLFDASGRLWATTRRHGVLRFDHPRAEHPEARAYTVEDGLTTNHVVCLAEDRLGRVYLGTIRGVDRLDPETGHVRRFSSADGLPVPRVHVAFTDRRGAV